LQSKILGEAHPIVKLLLPLLLIMITYNAGGISVKLLVVVFTIALLMLTSKPRMTGLVLYSLMLLTGYAVVGIVAKPSLTQWVSGALNLLSIVFSLSLLAFIIDPSDLDYIAVKTRVWDSTGYMVLRSSIIILTTMLTDVSEAFSSVKAKHRGRLIGVSSIKFIIKALATSVITISSRITEFAETLYLYPPKPVIRRYSLGNQLTILDVVLLLILLYILKV